MTQPAQVPSFIPYEYDLFGGLDVDKKSMAVTFKDHGNLQRSLKLPYSAPHLLSYTRKHFPDKRVAFVYEAGPTGFGLHDELTAANHFCLVVSPAMVPTAPGQRVKTNRLDSKKLAEGLRGGQLQAIHVPAEKYRELRHLVQLRDTHVQQLTASKYRIKSLLLYEGIPFPDAHERWSAPALQQLQELPCNSTVRFKLDRLLDALQFHFHTAAKVQKEVRRFCHQDLELRQCIAYLASVPGIGTITATHALARLGDWRQISNGRQIAGFLGLVSSERSTGDKENRGSITRKGDSRLRNKLIQCAWVAIKQDPELYAFYRRIYQRQPAKVAARKAIVAVARKLTWRMYVVLKEQRPYIKRPLTLDTAGPRGSLDTAQNEQREL